MLPSSGAVIASLAVIGVLIALISFYSARYHKVGPNEALIIYGRGKRGSHVVVGGGVFVWPIVEATQRLSLEIMTLDVTTPEVYTLHGVPIIVDGVAQVKVDGSEEMIRTAAEQFLGKSCQETETVALQTVEGHLRAILGQLTVEDVYKNRDAFAQQVQEVAASDLANMGLRIVSFTIRDIRDSRGYLEALGKPRTAEVKRDAVIGEAVAQRDATIRSAQANQEGEEARFVADAKIAEAERDYKIKKAEFEQAVQQRQAEADLSYELQRFKTSQEIKREEVQVDVIEKQTRIQVEEAEIQRKERELQATVHRPADAENYRIRTLAQAERDRMETEAAGKGNAVRTVGTGEADALKAKGLAEADVAKARGMAEADVARAQGLAEGDAIQAKGSGEAEAMMKKAEAWAHYNQAAVVEKVVEVLPAIASAIAAPLAKTERIVMVNTGDGGGVGAAKITSDVSTIIAQLPPILEALAGINLSELVKTVPALSAQAAKGPEGAGEE